MKRRLLGLLCFVPIVALLIFIWPIVAMVGGALLLVIAAASIGAGFEWLGRKGVKLMFNEDV